MPGWENDQVSQPVEITSLPTLAGESARKLPSTVELEKPRDGLQSG